MALLACARIALSWVAVSPPRASAMRDSFDTGIALDASQQNETSPLPPRKSGPTNAIRQRASLLQTRGPTSCPKLKKSRVCIGNEIQKQPRPSDVDACRGFCGSISAMCCEAQVDSDAVTECVGYGPAFLPATVEASDDEKWHGALCYGGRQHFV